MKKYVILIGVLAALSVSAEPPRSDGSLQTSGAQAAKKRSALTQPGKPNEIVKENVTFSGIAVQLVKTDNPLQLVNPLAPARYGSPEDNTLHDPISGKISGLKIFSIRF